MITRKVDGDVLWIFGDTNKIVDVLFAGFEIMVTNGVKLFDFGHVVFCGIWFLQRAPAFLKESNPYSGYPGLNF